MNHQPLVGQSVNRKEGLAKLSGTAKYVDDLSLPGMLHGATVRSTVPRGRITSIEFSSGLPWHEFTIVTAKDIPGLNRVTLLELDQPFLAEKEIQHVGEAIVLLAHPDKSMLEAGRRGVHVRVESLPAILSLDEATKNCKSFRIEKGNVDEIWDQAHLIVDGEYFTEAQEHLYIEPNGMMAEVNPKEGVTVWGSMQCPYYVQKALKPLFNLSGDKVRIIQTETGGGFGGKEDYPSVIAGHAALLAWKSAKPVKIIYDRAEDMIATTKRHPSRTRHRTAVDENGRLLAMDIEFVLDAGAYTTLSPVVLSRGTIHAAGPYACENVCVSSRALITNYPPYGAFRGFGAPQSIFALERHLDKVAARLGMEPDEFRRRNFIKPQGTTATSQVIREQIDLDKLLKAALKHSQYHQKKKKYSIENKTSSIKRGVGLACFMHGAGFTGSGEKILASRVGVEAMADGKIHVLSANTEIGQGTNTIFAQITAESLGLHYDDITVAQPDTRFVPDSGPTVASRTCMIVGNLIRQAALKLQSTLIQSGHLSKEHSRDDFLRGCSAYLKQFGTLKSDTQYQPPEGLEWDDKAYKGDAYATYATAVYVADVAVDMTTYEVRVEDMVAVQEVGKVIHPVLAAGQIEGGIAQAIGFALYEKVVWKDGEMLNHQMTNYIMPTATDIAKMRVYFLEENRQHGPFGAKGIGELPMDGPAPAILNAIEQATGLSLNRIPVLPEDLHSAWEASCLRQR